MSKSKQVLAIGTNGFLSTMCLALRDAFQIVPFGSPQGLLNWTERGMPGAVLMLDQTPGLSGRELAEELRRRGYTGAIVMLSDKTDDDAMRPYGITKVLPQKLEIRPNDIKDVLCDLMAQPATAAAR